MEEDIGGKQYKCHLDTGCNHRVIPRKLIPKAHMQPTSVRVSAANGTEIPILGQVRLGFLVQNLDMAADLLLADDIDELILGYDWLLLQGVDWNFRQCQLVLHGVTIPFTSRPARFSLRCVYIRELASASPAGTETKATEALGTTVGNGTTPQPEQDTTARPRCEHVQSVIDTLAPELEECVE